MTLSDSADQETD